jgi:ABC-type Na+ efflux pump permease subunit
VLAGIAQLGLWAALLYHRDLLRPSISQRRVRYVTVQLARAPLIFAVSIVIALTVGPIAAMASWAMLVLVELLIRRAFRDSSIAATALETSATAQA